VLRRVLECATELVGARYGALGILDADRDGLVDFLHVGLDPERAADIGDAPTGAGLLGQLIADPRPLRLDDLRNHPAATGFPAAHPIMSSFLGVPVRVRGDVFGNLYLANKLDGRPFSVADEQLTVALAAVAGVAVENSRLHARVSDLAVVEERERIARELHDTVVQRIFSIGLALQGMGQRVDDPAVTAGLQRAASDLDDTVHQIRTTVLHLDRADDELRPVQRELQEYVDELAQGLGLTTSVRFVGDVDAVVGAEATGSVVESLFAVARSAIVALRAEWRAEHADLAVTIGPELTLHIGTEAEAPGGDPAGWLRELEMRAEALGGRMAVASSTGGAEIIWTVPLGYA
jgi:hypothetical protein